MPRCNSKSPVTDDDFGGMRNFCHLDAGHEGLHQAGDSPDNAIAWQAGHPAVTMASRSVAARLRALASLPENIRLMGELVELASELDPR